MRGRIVALIAMLALACAATAGPALADGDPASDVLATQSLFLPQDASLPARQQVALAELLAAAGRAGYPLRVALVASPSDLGSVTELWRQPQAYARFLGQELSTVYGGPLLVVMPDGVGVYAGSARATPLATVSPPAATGLGAAAIAAVQRLAAAAGHPLAVPSAVAPAPRGGSDPGAVIALVVGALLVCLAWAASFRALPLRGNRRALGTG